MGVYSLYSNTTGYSNVALGQSALRNNTTGNYNVALGKSALYSNTKGEYNVALGYNVQSGDFSNSIIIGVSASATTNNQLVLGSSTTQVGPVTMSTFSQTHAIDILLNGNSYKILLHKP
jgi:hypothetical protein